MSNISAIKLGENGLEKLIWFVFLTNEYGVPKSVIAKDMFIFNFINSVKSGEFFKNICRNNGRLTIKKVWSAVTKDLEDRGEENIECELGWDFYRQLSLDKDKINSEEDLRNYMDGFQLKEKEVPEQLIAYVEDKMTGSDYDGWEDNERIVSIQGYDGYTTYHRYNPLTNQMTYIKGSRHWGAQGTDEACLDGYEDDIYDDELDNKDYQDVLEEIKQEKRKLLAELQVVQTGIAGAEFNIHTVQTDRNRANQKSDKNVAVQPEAVKAEAAKAEAVKAEAAKAEAAKAEAAKAEAAKAEAVKSEAVKAVENKVSENIETYEKTGKLYLNNTRHLVKVEDGESYVEITAKVNERNINIKGKLFENGKVTVLNGSTVGDLIVTSENYEGIKALRDKYRYQLSGNTLKTCVSFTNVIKAYEFIFGYTGNNPWETFKNLEKDDIEIYKTKKTKEITPEEIDAWADSFRKRFLDEEGAEFIYGGTIRVRLLERKVPYMEGTIDVLSKILTVERCAFSEFDNQKFKSLEAFLASVMIKKKVLSDLDDKLKECVEGYMRNFELTCDKQDEPIIIT